MKHAMPSIALICGLCAAHPSFAAPLDASTQWQDVAPTATVSSVVGQFAAPPGNYAAVSNAAMNAVQKSTNYTDAAVSNLTRSAVQRNTLTNDVCNIVTNEVREYGQWRFGGAADGFSVLNMRYFAGVWTLNFTIADSDGGQVSTEGAADATKLYFESLGRGRWVERDRITRNAIGLARLTDLPPLTNGLASAAATNALDASLSSRLSLASLAASNYTDIAVSRLAQRTNDWDAAAQNASDALAYSRATYDFQQGNTNAWFSGTNYVFGADATNKTMFAFEPGMDLAIMPCSLALMELRDGTTQKVWDQRDWTVWYWNFKNAQQEASIAARFAAAAEFNATNYAPIAWGRRTSSGLANPDSKTLWVDAEKTVLAPGMAWESTVEVSGCAYWTIVGNATLSGNTNGVISILDFEGNPVFRIRKTASHLVTLETGSEIYTSGWDAQGRITYTMRASVHPVGVFSTVLDDSLFVEETNAGCPVDYEWETLEQPSANSPGVYRIHFLLKPGISSDGCFAKFKVEVQGETAVEFFAVQKITGGQVYDDGVHGDVKIRPVITSTAVGSVVTWEVAP